MNTDKTKTANDMLIELKKEISKIQSSANSFHQLEDFFNTNPLIQPYYNEVQEQCRQDNYFGISTMMILTIEKLLSKIDDQD